MGASAGGCRRRVIYGVFAVVIGAVATNAACAFTQTHINAVGLIVFGLVSFHAGSIFDGKKRR